MSKKTAAGLVEHMKKGLAAGNGYVWGTFGQVLTEGVLKSKVTQYPQEVGGKLDIIKSKWMGKTVTDCVGAIKFYLWLDDAGKVQYDSKTDRSAGGMLKAASVKGPIATMPNRPGLAVCVDPTHIGVYIGDGKVIEANSTAKGWIMTPLRGLHATKWTHWCEVPGIDYGPTGVKPAADGFVEALAELVEKGVINSPDIWRDQAKKGGVVPGEFARQLIINMAKVLK